MRIYLQTFRWWQRQVKTGWPSADDWWAQISAGIGIVNHGSFSLHSNRSGRTQIQLCAAAAGDKKNERKDGQSGKERSELDCAAHVRTVADVGAATRAVLLAV